MLVRYPISKAVRQMHEFREVNTRNINMEEINAWTEYRALGMDKMF